MSKRSKELLNLYILILLFFFIQTYFSKPCNFWLNVFFLKDSDAYSILSYKILVTKIHGILYRQRLNEPTVFETASVSAGAEDETD